MTPPRPALHLHVESGPLTLDFQGHPDQVDHVAAELAISAAVTVAVDDRVTPGMPKLPCSRLWEEPGLCAQEEEPGEMNCAAAMPDACERSTPSATDPIDPYLVW